MTKYREVYYTSSDGLRLYARDYRRQGAPLTILCLHGLTRNARDFEVVAARLSRKYRVIVADQRGRGRSAYDPEPARYHPGTYVADMFALLDHLGVERVVTLGTSMGGLMSMIMTAMQPGRIAGLVLNDIGPVVDPQGLARIKGYAGKTAPVTSWAGAARRIQQIYAPMFPDLDAGEWMGLARRTYREDAAGVPVLDYDPAIAQPLADEQDQAVPPDLWPAFEATRGRPLLVIRGELSDILAPATAAEMGARHDDCSCVTVPARGHAPMLDEPEAARALDDFLAALGGRAMSG